GRRDDAPAQAEDLEGPTLSLMARLARELRLYLLAGSIYERVPGQTRSHNTSVLFGPDGARLAVYRKIHLFDVDLPGRVTVRESEAMLPGAEMSCVETALGAIGMTICYDLRFPEL